MSFSPGRRTFLRSTLLGMLLAPATAAARRRYAYPVATNVLRPPGAVTEEHFAATCIRCGRCVEICPYLCIKPLDIRSGVNAGSPIIEIENIPCYLCMKCVEVCPTEALRRIPQAQTRMGVAVVDRYTCVSWKDKILCRTCYSVCPFMDKAIRLQEFKPVIDERHCTGCGICTHACPVPRQQGGKAVNVEPIYAREFTLPEEAQQIGGAG